MVFLVTDSKLEKKGEIFLHVYETFTNVLTYIPVKSIKCQYIITVCYPLADKQDEMNEVVSFTVYLII